MVMHYIPSEVLQVHTNNLDMIYQCCM